SFVSSPARVPRDLPSFPTRRSSDLGSEHVVPTHTVAAGRSATFRTTTLRGRKTWSASRCMSHAAPSPLGPSTSTRVEVLGPRGRSEEHTSELQSRSDLVCRLLLEKK